MSNKYTLLVISKIKIRTEKNKYSESYRWVCSKNAYETIKSLNIDLVRYLIPILKSISSPLMSYYINTNCEDYDEQHENILDFIRKKGLRHEVLQNEITYKNKESELGFLSYQLHVLNTWDVDKLIDNANKLIKLRDEMIDGLNIKIEILENRLKENEGLLDINEFEPIKETKLENNDKIDELKKGLTEQLKEINDKMEAKYNFRKLV